MIYDSDQTFISVVVPVKNEVGHILKCLCALRASLSRKFKYEIIVVDNGSSDGTFELVNDYMNENNDVYLYAKVGGTIASVRMYGYNKSKGNIVAFIDGDSVVPENWISEGINILRRSKDVSAVGFALKPPGNESTWIERTWFNISSGSKWEGTIEVSWLPSFNILISREYFEMVGGFNETLTTCEDADLGYRLNKISKLIYSDVLYVEHLGNVRTLRQFVNKELWRGSDNFRSLITSMSVSGLPSVLLPLLYLVINIFVIIKMYHFATGKFEISKMAIEGIMMLTITMIMAVRAKLRNPIDIVNAILLLHIYLMVRGVAIVYRKKQN